jgi:predicted nuclease of restriction endonuclease-like (RecB) superfamily
MNYYNEIKQELINNEVYKKVKDYSKNRNDLNTYYNVGKLIVEAQGGEERAKYGDKLIQKYSLKLTEELGIGYSTRSLKRMRKFYLYVRKGTAMMTQLTWTHYVELLVLNDINTINYYIKISLEQKLSYRELHTKIKNKEYERLDENTKQKLINKDEPILSDFIKNPILIKNKYKYNKISEKMLQQLILEDIPFFLKELGVGFTFIENEYKIKIGNNYNYIDLLLFNYKYNCFVVVELKVTELKKEHIGQIQIYMNYVDKNIKSINQDKTIGIIICKKENKFIIEYSSDNRILETRYELC